MPRKDKKKIKIDRTEIYQKLLDNYKEWQELMDVLKKEERDLRRDFLRFADQAKIKKVMRTLDR